MLYYNMLTMIWQYCVNGICAGMPILPCLRHFAYPLSVKQKVIDNHATFPVKIEIMKNFGEKKNDRTVYK